MEREDLAGTSIRIEAVDEVGLGASSGVAEGEGLAFLPDREPVLLQHPGRVPVVLLDGAGKMLALALGLHDTGDLGVNVQNVVGTAGGEGELADGHPPASQRVHLIAVLDEPATRVQHRVDRVPGLHLVERRRALCPVDDRISALGVDLARLPASSLIFRVLEASELSYLSAQLLDLSE